ncbi:MAG: hypothetical protein M1814_003314 [Vezdaea aestivalis]|nr:MAG: hypothetical protein M1814_003314 [Vezdaea aestivalis]
MFEIPVRRHRSHEELSELKNHPSLNIPRPATAVPWGPSRPLSDIKETAESDAAESSRRETFQKIRASFDSIFDDNTSDHEIPPSLLPRRRSSKLQKRKSQGSQRSTRREPSIYRLRPASEDEEVLPTRRRSISPIRKQAELHEPVSSDVFRRAPSRTFVRLKKANDVLEAPELKHPRVKIDTRITSPLYMGGGTIEGKIIFDISRNRAKASCSSGIFGISRISVDIVGAEQVSKAPPVIFLSLANELIDNANPPPASMLATGQVTLGPQSRQAWEIETSVSTLPFQINLPLDVGPGSFTLNQTRIFYVLCVTAIFLIEGKLHFVRQSRSINLVPAFDPEKALVPLPSPLTASDEKVLGRRDRLQSVQLTAGIHRQTWISGTSLFADIFVANKSSHSTRKLRVDLERCVMTYKFGWGVQGKHGLSSSPFYFAAATSSNISASGLRVCDRLESKVVSSISLAGKGGTAVRGTAAHSNETITCEVPIPRGHVSIGPGRYFEVRYRLNVIVKIGLSSRVAVQLPVTIIHMNSLDIIPNSLQSVAATLEEQRMGGLEMLIPERLANMSGRAFAAPRKKSMDQLRRQRSRTDIQGLEQELEASPRKRRPPTRGMRRTDGSPTKTSRRKRPSFDGRESGDFEILSSNRVYGPDTRLYKGTSGLHFGSGLEDQSVEYYEPEFGAFSNINHLRENGHERELSDRRQENARWKDATIDNHPQLWI